MTKFCRVAFVVLAGLVWFAGSSLAQSALGSITGVVTDQQGALVAGANVTVTEVDTNVKRTGVTSAEGVYAFADLLPGKYFVTVKETGFKELKSSPIILTAAQSSRFDAKLEVGAASETIEVTAAPAAINTVGAEVGDLRNQQELITAPIQRSTLQSIVLTPGTVSGVSSSVMIGGVRSVYSNLTIDGITTFNNIFGGQSGGLTADQSFESISEVKVLESNNSAEFPGVTTLMTTTKSGGNVFHGSAFYQTDNSALDAGPLNSAPGSKGIGPQLQWYGGSFSGPVILPKYNGHNRTFFLATWEHRTFPLAAGNAQTFQGVSVPTAAFDQGDFSALLNPSIQNPPIQLKNPLTGVPFPNNQIPASMISSVAKGFIGLPAFAAPNTGAANSYVNNYTGFGTSPEHIDRFDIKIDQHFGDKNMLSGRITRQTDPQPGNWDSNNTIFGHAKVRNFENAYFSETHIFAPTLLNEFRLGWARDFLTITDFHDGNKVLQATGLQGFNVPAGVSGMPELDFNQSGINGTFEVPPEAALSQTYELMDNLTWQKGRHTIKTGVLIRYGQPSQGQGNSTEQFGKFQFDGSFSGFDFADFLLGIPAQSQRNVNPPSRYNRFTNPGLFVVDTWNASPKLTVTLGLRWEYFMPPVDNNDRRANFDPATGAVVLPNQNSEIYVSPFFPKYIPLEVSPAGFPGRSMLYGDWKNFGPRVSLAYRLSNKLVVRGGYGIYYAGITAAYLDSLAGGGLFAQQQNFQNSVTNGTPLFQFPNPFPTALQGICTANCGTSVSGTDPHLKIPTTQQWNFTVERELGHQLVAHAGYRGFMTTQIPVVDDLNIPPASTNPKNKSIYLNPNFSRITWTSDGAIQKMNALDLDIQRKFANGVTFQGSYTLAKNTTDDGSSDGESGSPQNPYNRAADMGNISYQPRHRFVAHAVWDVPFGKGMKYGSSAPKAVDYVLGGWELAVPVVIQSGTFLTPTYSGSTALGGASQNIRANNGAALRPDCLVSNPTLSQQVWGWQGQSVSPSNFQAPALGSYGTCGVGILHGPGAWQINIGLHKSFSVTERLRVKFEANMMNALNHANMGNPTMNINSGSFGLINGTNGGLNLLNPTVTTANGERHIFAGIRLEF